MRVKMTSDLQKKALSDWFYDLQSDIMAEFEVIEDEFKHPTQLPGRFRKKNWQRSRCNSSSEPGGGGTMSLMQGAVFEKVGVNVSVVEGEFEPEFRSEIPGAEENPHFWAAGISLVAHPMNPYVPAVHMNTRHIITSKTWFGGGADLTPTFEYSQDTNEFHQAMRTACDKHDENYYPKFKLWCDEYFYLPHRQETRGVGGIFYDYVNSENFDNDFAFTRDVGTAFKEIYPTLVRRRMHEEWDNESKYEQLKKRSKYAEFNLLYDRGTKFGLKTQGNVEAILMSMPPVATWETNI